MKGLDEDILGDFQLMEEEEDRHNDESSTYKYKDI